MIDFFKSLFYFEVIVVELPTVTWHFLVLRILWTSSPVEVDLLPQGGSLNFSEGTSLLGTLGCGWALGLQGWVP